MPSEFLLPLAQAVIARTESTLTTGSGNRISSSRETGILVDAQRALYLTLKIGNTGRCNLDVGNDDRPPFFQAVLPDQYNSYPAMNTIISAVITGLSGAGNCEEYAGVATLEAARTMFANNANHNRQTFSVHCVKSAQEDHSWCEIRKADGLKRNDDIIIDAYPSGGFYAYDNQGNLIVSVAADTSTAKLRRDCDNGCKGQTNIIASIDSISAPGILRFADALKERLQSVSIGSVLLTERLKTSYFAEVEEGGRDFHPTITGFSEGGAFMRGRDGIRILPPQSIISDTEPAMPENPWAQARMQEAAPSWHERY